MISEGSCDTEDWRNDAENIKIEIFDFKSVYVTFRSLSCLIIIDWHILCAANFLVFNHFLIYYDFKEVLIQL